MKNDMKNTATKKIKIGLVTARFNAKITEELELGALDFLDSLKDDFEVDIWAVRVPGAVEIPLAVQTLLDQGCDGVVALGCVIRGETTHYEQVCNSLERALTTMILEKKSPIGFGVLTVENMKQAKDRIGGKHGHKGAEAAQATVEMISLLRQLRQGQGFIEGTPARIPLSEPPSAKAKKLKALSKLQKG
jgi:6,7-dimethyl-8-ribityllumazine synthase